MEPYLERCVKSITKANYENLEVILVDDGSQDGCPEICDRWAARDARIRVIHKPNGGLVSARKAGLEIATGDYATYVDGDDWIEPEMYDCLNRYDVDLIVQGFVSDRGKTSARVLNRVSSGVYEGEHLQRLRTEMLVDDQGKFQLYPCVWNKIFRKEKLKKFQNLVPDRVSMGEDVAVTYRYLLEADQVVITDDCHYHYILNPSGMTSKKDIRYIEKCYALFDYLMQVDGLPREQIDNYFCSMMINGISILFDPRVKADKSYCRQMAEQYHHQQGLQQRVQGSRRYQRNRNSRFMINTFSRKQFFLTMLGTCIYIARCHLIKG